MATGIKSSRLQLVPVPIPPVEEQRRIVAKVSELMALCNALEARLTRAREKSTHLAASVVHHLGAA
jgi:type I restriction enzyme, S subunit